MEITLQIKKQIFGTSRTFFSTNTGRYIVIKELDMQEIYQTGKKYVYEQKQEQETHGP